MLEFDEIERGYRSFADYDGLSKPSSSQQDLYKYECLHNVDHDQYELKKNEDDALKKTI
jgi:hypothetical protein